MAACGGGALARRRPLDVATSLLPAMASRKGSGLWEEEGKGGEEGRGTAKENEEQVAEEKEN